MLITLGTVNQVLVFIQATTTFKVMLLFLGKCTINPALWTLRSSIQRNEGRDQKTLQALKHLPVYRGATRDKSNSRLKAATSQLLLHRNDRSRKVSIHRRIMEELLTCFYVSINKLYVAVYTWGIFIPLLLRKNQSQNAFKLKVYVVYVVLVTKWYHYQNETFTV